MRDRMDPLTTNIFGNFGVSLRDYQAQLVRDTLTALGTHKRVVVACPTGSGKTVIAVHGLLPSLPKRTAWITHRKELAKQVKDHNPEITVFMAQGEITGDYDALIIDEGHHVCAAKYRSLLATYSAATVIALTATPYRLDGVGLGSCGFSKIILGPDIYELTENGTLCPVRVYVPASEHSAAWLPSAAAEKIANTRFTKGIAYCRSVKEAEEIAACLSDAGIKACSIDGTTNPRIRARIFKRFLRGSIKVLCNHTIFTEGVDVPGIDLVVLNRHTHSRCLWKQMIGRGTRKHTGKKMCVILDLAGNGVRHGSVYDKEIYDLYGRVGATETRFAPEDFEEEKKNQEYNHNKGEELKEWKPQPKPLRLIENLQRLRYTSPLHRFKTA